MGNADLLCEMLATRGELLRQLKGLREETARTRPEPNEWSVWEVLEHVADVDGLYSMRIGQILAGETELKANDPADWEAARSAAAKGGLAGVLQRFYAARVEVLRAVSELGPADMEKSGKHPIRGPMTIRQLIESVIRHDLDHAEQVAKTRAVVEA